MQKVMEGDQESFHKERGTPENIRLEEQENTNGTDSSKPLQTRRERSEDPDKDLKVSPECDQIANEEELKRPDRPLLGDRISADIERGTLGQFWTWQIF